MNSGDKPAQPTARLDRRRFLGATVAAGSALVAAPGQAAPRPVRDMPFSTGWRFLRGDAVGAEQPGFDDTQWRKLDLPHDWSIEDVPGAPARPEPWAAPAAIWNTTQRPAPKSGEVLHFGLELPTTEAPGVPRRVGPFDADASVGSWGAGWTVGGVGWYRKAFAVSDLAADERLEIRFEGVYHDAEVWLNGARLGSHDHGHSGFAFDLTPHLVAGAANVIAVRVRNEGFNSRWYNGSGIYRSVWLTRTRAVRIPMWGVFASTPDVSTHEATVRVAVEVENLGRDPAPVTVKVTIRDAAGRAVAAATGEVEATPGGRSEVTLTCKVGAPRLWSPRAPRMYAAEVTLATGARDIDQVTTPFGIRTIAADAVNGLTINGETVKLKGACLHHDNGLLGVAAYDRAEIRKVELLKANGFNAIRCAHNLYSPAFYAACDRLGMIVIDEMFDVWNEGKFGHDLGSTRFKSRWRDDVRDMVRRDRNHPSIAFWSIGNEITDSVKPSGVKTAADLRQAILELDDTRLITAALAGLSGAFGEPARRSLDVVGYNYMQDAYEKDHAAYPDMVFMGTEQFARDIHDAWRKVELYPWLIGDFVWTGIDYVGEVGAGSSRLRRDGETSQSKLPISIFLWDYPAFQGGCGEIDLIGLKKPQSYYRDVLWGRSPLELFVQRPAPEGFHEEVGTWAFPDELRSWTWPEGGVMAVRAYTGGDEVRLLLNGKEVERKTVLPADKLIAAFQVAYQPGDLVAVAYRAGKELARQTLKTVGPAAKLRLRAERSRVPTAHGELAYVYAEVCDAEGRVVPDAQVPLEFAVQGPARMVASGAANPRGLESFTDQYCTTFHGVAQAILAPAGRRGEARLSVSAPGLTGHTIGIAFG